MGLEDKNKNILSFVSKRPISIFSNFALKSFSTQKTPKFPELILLIFEYLQLLSQSILLYSRFSESEIIASKPIFNAVLYTAKLINPSAFLSFDEDFSTTKFVLAGLIVFMAFKYIVFISFFLMTLYNSKQARNLSIFWKWAFRIQGRVMYYFLSSYWTYCLFAAFQQDSDFDGVNKVFVIGISFVLIIIEVFFTLFLESVGCYFLPQKSLFARKDNVIAGMTFSQKVMLQLLHISLPWNTQSQTWTVLIVTLAFNAARIYHFITTLPLYKVQALMLETILLVIVTSLNLAFILNEICQTASPDVVDERFVVVIWAFILILSAKFGRDFMKYKIFRLVTEPEQATPQATNS